MHAVAIGRALVLRTRMTLMDERCGDRREQLRQRTVRLSSSASSKPGADACSYVTHDQTEEMTPNPSQPIGVLDRGTLVAARHAANRSKRTRRQYVAARLGSPRLNLVAECGVAALAARSVLDGRLRASTAVASRWAGKVESDAMVGHRSG